MTFSQDEAGAVTVDWVVLTAALVGLGLAVSAVVSGGVEDLSGDVETQLKREDIIKTSFDPALRDILNRETIFEATNITCPGNAAPVDGQSLTAQACSLNYVTSRYYYTLDDGTVFAMQPTDTYTDNLYQGTNHSYYELVGNALVPFNHPDLPPVEMLALEDDYTPVDISTLRGLSAGI